MLYTELQGPVSNIARIAQAMTHEMMQIADQVCTKIPGRITDAGRT